MTQAKFRTEQPPMVLRTRSKISGSARICNYVHLDNPLPICNSSPHLRTKNRLEERGS